MEKKFGTEQVRKHLYDSLTAVSNRTGVPFYERVVNFSIEHWDSEYQSLAVPMPQASRLIYSVSFIHEGGMQIIYDYLGKNNCGNDESLFVLVFPKLSFKPDSISISTFVSQETISKVGFASSPEAFYEISQSVCFSSSFMATPSALSGEVNTFSSEVKPIVSLDGRSIYFHRQNNGGNVGGKRDVQDIYLSRLNDKGEWIQTLNLGNPLNNKGSNGIASISAGENRLYLLNEYTSNGTRDGLSFSDKGVEGWTSPQLLPIKDFYNASPYFDYCVSANQMTMVLALEDDESWGDQDLYVSHYDPLADEWSKPRNMGTVLNTPWGEASPFLAADGKTLYFSSEGHLGYGGFDLYVTKRLDDTWMNWSSPSNLGPIINDEFDNLYFSVSAKADKAYFSSGNGEGRDIYEINLPKLFKPKPVELVTGRFVDVGTGKQLKGRVQVESLSTPSFHLEVLTDSLTGMARFALPANDSYWFKVQADGYHILEGTYSTDGLEKYREKNLTVPLVPEATVFPVEAYSGTGEIDTTVLSIFYELAYPMTVGMASPAREVNLKSLKQNIRSEYVNSNVESQHVLLLKGRIIEGEGLSPVGSTLLFYQKGAPKARTISNPRNGSYQTVVGDNSIFSVLVTREGHPNDTIRITIPAEDGYAELQRNIYLDCQKGDSARVRLGSGMLGGVKRENMLFFKERRQAKRLVESIATKNIGTPVFEEDLAFLNEVLADNPNWSAKVQVASPHHFSQEGLLEGYLKKNIQNGVDIAYEIKKEKKNKRNPKAITVYVDIYFY
ncbi:hypothetical protein QWY31_06270 [Cytophagales bacterium LB-30]|uniref:Uncharacterized protein n=1 Tax=Shiella aurantiaca TaxID=3058365 RepID=A0ABT8F3R2_9BACT|nr:hypothetical protein [Shiella aurantiaca]MDN4165097.1 hypothetical protein [Shiella aurantiaca]